MRTLFAMAVSLLGLGTSTASLAADRPAATREATAWDFTFIDIAGEPLPLSRFQGKALLVVNTASLCGFTRQYEGLEQLHKTYGPRGLVVLAVPSNDFGNQEPGSDQEIREFCDSKFKLTLPLTTKSQVIGADAHPFFQWATGHFGDVARPRWNFHKFLVGPDGKLVTWFSSFTAPSSSKVTKAIESVLPQGS